MCMEDIRIGRKVQTAARIVNLADNSNTPLVAFSADRVFLSVSTNSLQARIAPSGGDATSDGSFLVGSAVAPLHFHVDRYGDAVTKPWTGSGIGGGVDVLVIEGFLEAR